MTIKPPQTRTAVVLLSPCNRNGSLPSTALARNFTMDLHHIFLDQLKAAMIVVRHDRKSLDVSDVLPSIRASSAAQPLLVQQNGENIEFVAGGGASSW